MTLASTTDVENRLGRSLTSAEEDRAGFLLDDVSASLILYTGQKFAHDTYELRARVKRGYVRLPQRPVHDVDTVTDRNDNDLEFTWDGLDRVYVATCALVGRAPVQVVDITYDAGPDEVPPAIVGVTCGIVLRSLGVDPMQTSVTQESIDGYAYTIGSAAGAGAYGILPAEARVLDSFRRPAASIQVGA